MNVNEREVDNQDLFCICWLHLFFGLFGLAGRQTVSAKQVRVDSSGRREFSTGIFLAHLYDCTEEMPLA